jgi:hypothetical protein
MSSIAPIALVKFKNLIDVANNYQQYQNLYFFLKNFAFTRAYNVLSKDYSGVSESDRQAFDYLLSEYQQEKAMVKPTYVMSKKEYVEFLDNFFSNYDMDTAPVYILEVSRDLSEALGVFGDFDDLWLKRSNLFKINYFLY